ncbi:hypothetical protein L6452_41533 [Arctium lappa]|uniref:Uncharacterized protein n=1 Tax=Arctium lappa TaxID=4217 RepID=A0ACB8XPP3_ARCLA|nr:hypothetical protein L6452_41533 [Arctium lappa]
MFPNSKPLAVCNVQYFIALSLKLSEVSGPSTLKRGYSLPFGAPPPDRSCGRYGGWFFDLGRGEYSFVAKTFMP